MEERDADRQEEIREAFAAIGLSLEQIREEYDNAYAEVSSLIMKLEETENANHEETLLVLNVMKTSMEESSIESLTHITDSLQIMEEKFSASINNKTAAI